MTTHSSRADVATAKPGRYPHLGRELEFTPEATATTVLADELELIWRRSTA